VGEGVELVRRSLKYGVRIEKKLIGWSTLICLGIEEWRGTKKGKKSTTPWRNLLHAGRTSVGSHGLVAGKTKRQTVISQLKKDGGAEDVTITSRKSEKLKGCTFGEVMSLYAKRGT